jgi:hypothetical protein
MTSIATIPGFSENLPARADADSASWAMIACLLLLTAILMGPSTLHMEPFGNMPVIIGCGALCLAAAFYRFVRPIEKLSVMCIGLCQVLLFSALGSLLSYQLAQYGGALWDEQFAAWDAALGFDWIGFVRFFDQHGWTILPLKIAYASLIPQIIALVLVLGFAARLTELRRIMFAAMLCGILTVLASAFFPAMSNYVHLGLTQKDFVHIDPYAGYLHLEHLTALRAQQPLAIQFDQMQGIITFPSYHAGLATVTLWGFWIARYYWIRWPGAILAAATIVATPIDGGHYLVDLLAGMAVAVFSIRISYRAIRWRPADLIATPKRAIAATEG